jgi:hypothetical protein
MVEHTVMSVDITPNNGDQIMPGQYPTSDIEMACTLLTLGHKLVTYIEKERPDGHHKGNRAGRPRGSHTEFVFEHDKVKDDLIKWFNGTLSVNPRDLLNNFSDMKNSVHNKGAK